MEYIINGATEGIDFSSYHDYLQTIRTRMPEHLYAFASDPRNFDLTASSSLHDAWLESLNVREQASGSRNEVRRLEVSLCLLGSNHDRLIHLSYSGVERYLFDAPNRAGDARFDHIAHGDLHTHEIRLVRDGVFVHGQKLLVRCGQPLSSMLDIKNYSGYVYRARSTKCGLDQYAPTVQLCTVCAPKQLALGGPRHRRY